VVGKHSSDGYSTNLIGKKPSSRRIHNKRQVWPLYAESLPLLLAETLFHARGNADYQSVVLSEVLERQAIAISLTVRHLEDE
jgi:hypothetical protein